MLLAGETLTVRTPHQQQRARRGEDEKVTTTQAEFNDKFRRDELLVMANEYWSWSVRPVPCTLGAGILSLNRFAIAFGDVTVAEAADLQRLVATMERRLTDTFAADKFNYFMLMMVDAHVHFHVLPRYAHSRRFAGLLWHDTGWPKLPTLADYEDRATSPALVTVRDALRTG